jgi:predicted O-methyltransferase YrrM
MNDSIIANKPKILPEIEVKSKEIGYSMTSDHYVGSLLKTLVTSKPKSRFLELGTGTGLSLSWMIDGMDADSRLITIDHDPKLTKLAQGYFGEDKRVEILCMDGAKWINNYRGEGFDLVFADAWPGKYSDIEKLLDLINVGGFYIVDDMSIQPNWPKGHDENVKHLVDYLEKREDFHMTKLNWSTGIILMTRKT